MELINNISHSFVNLQSDYVGFNVNLGEFFLSLFFLLTAFGIFFIVFVVGEKARGKYFKDITEPHITPFISIALGYIVISTIIAILGLFSLINASSLIAVLLVSVAFTLSNLSFLKKSGSLYNAHFFKKRIQENAFLNVIVVIFICIGFLRLLLPETGVDAVSYNTDYPHLYIQNQTTMLSAKGSEIYITVPQLGAMPYVIADFLRARGASRFIHYLFFLSVILLLYVKNKKAGVYIVLLFVTSPVIIRLTSTAYTDFQWMLCWILSLFILNKKEISLKQYLLAGVLFGGALATKIWILAFFPIIISYVLLKQKSKKTLYLFIFILAAISTSGIWYIRSYIITGYPFYPNFSASIGTQFPAVSTFFSTEAIFFKVYNLQNLSPLALFLAITYLSFNSKLAWRKIFSPYSMTMFVLVYYLFLPIFYFAGRYLLLGYLLIIQPLGEYAVQIKRNKLFSFIFTTLLLLMVSYYGITNLLLMPYTVGLANRDKYIERILARDNSSYYDYEKKFSKWIIPDETIATYGLYGFYYANFRYKDTEYILEKERSLAVFKRSNIDKILIKHGDMNWFCKTVNISDCNQAQYRLLAYYEPAQQYLYELK